MGMGEKKSEIQSNENPNQGKKFAVWLPSHSPVNEMKADCFPVSENSENSWEGDPSLMGKNTGLGVVWAVKDRWYELYTCEIPRSSTRVGWSEGFLCGLEWRGKKERVSL